MLYTVFALKWRPKNFDEIVGQEHVVTTLKSSLEKKRLAHAYLFAGPRGVGKTSTARILAKALNCKDGPTANPCGKCSFCLEISQARSFDVIEIDGASNRGIDEIRMLRENVKFAPTQGKYKIYIIDEVHMLTTEAFNALLKTLEEPPEFVKFIFATTQPQKIIPTVLSRCHRFDFRRVSTMEIISQLKKIIESEKIDVDKEVLFTIAKSSDGSLRDAESVLDQLVSFSKDKIQLKDVVSVLGMVGQEVFFEITEKIKNKDPKGVLEMLNNVIDGGIDANIFLTNFIEHFRNLMIAKVTKADSKLIDLPDDICERLFEQSKFFNLDEIFTIFRVLVDTQEMSRRLESLRIPLEISLVKLTQDKKDVSGGAESPPLKRPPESKPNPESEKGNLGYTHKPVVPLKEGKAISSFSEIKEEKKSVNIIKTISLDEVKSAWKNIISRLSTVKMSVSTYLNEGTLMEVKDNILKIAFPKNYSLHKESLEAKENKSIIEKIISEIFSVNLKVYFILSQDIIEQHSEDDSLIKAALDTFNGRVVKRD